MTEEVFGDSRLWHVYSYLLLCANYRTATLDNGMHLDVGECVVSQQLASNFLGMARETLRNKLNRLVQLGLIEKHVISGRKGTRIKLLKYKDSQGNIDREWPEKQPVNQPANQPQNKKKRNKEEKKTSVCFDSLEYPPNLDTGEVRSKLQLWVKHRNGTLSQLQLQSTLNASSRWSSEYFCRSLEHSIASGWKSVNPAPEDGLYAKKPPYKKPKQTKAQMAVENCERDLQELRYKRIGTTDKLELARLGEQKEQLIKRLGKLEGACKEHSC
jgi:DNA-binding HxlR family transcriptional regulator